MGGGEGVVTRTVTTEPDPNLECVRYSTADGVATITLDSPANRNALSRRLLRGLTARLRQLADDPGARVGVLTANGPAFCAGADLKEDRSGPEPPPSFPAILEAITGSDKPIVAVVKGPVRAGGVGLVAACDIVLAADSVTFALPEVRIGVVPAIISVPCLARMTNRAVTRYFLTGETFCAAEAVSAGLVTTAAPAEELAGLAARVVDGLLAAAPGALAGVKSLLRRVPVMPPSVAYPYAELVSERFFASEEAAEGRRAFAERRPPTWQT